MTRINFNYAINTLNAAEYIEHRNPSNTECAMHRIEAESNKNILESRQNSCSNSCAFLIAFSLSR